MNRLVRCPRCQKVLVEPSEVPAYECGGCHAILLVKKDINEKVVPDHDKELKILIAHMDAAQKAESYTHNIHPLDPESSDQALLKPLKMKSTLRLVRCPTCGNVLPEPADVLVYACGGCNAILRVKKQNNDTVDTEILKARAEVSQTAAMYNDSIPPLNPQSSVQTLLTHPKPNDLKIPLHAIKECTQDFNERNFVGKGGYGRVYKGNLTWAYNVNLLVAVKRLDVAGYQGNKEFYTELTMLSNYQHENIISLIGFCDDNKEMILVYEYASNGSLDTYLGDTAKTGRPSWRQLLKICIDVASALDYLHNHVAEKHRIIHRDIKAANILLDENWNAKLGDFGLSRIGLANQENTFVITNLAGTHGYCDPHYERTGFLTKESDVYSLGVVLFEVLCGRLACDFNYNDERRFLNHLARTCYKNGDIDKIIDRRIREDIKPSTLLKFSAIAYQCLQKTREKRPTIAEVAFQLKKAMEIQLEDERFSQMSYSSWY